MFVTLGEGIGFRVLVGEGAVTLIRDVTQCEFFEEGLITKGVVSNTETVDMATQTEVIDSVATNPIAAAPVMANPDPFEAAAQARPRRAGFDRRYIPRGGVRRVL